LKFWDRERELNWLKRYLQTEPNALLFIYGPKSSGKSTLLQRVVEELPKSDFKYYWYDLREEAITTYSSVLNLFFKEKGWLRRMLEFVSGVVRVNYGAFELSGGELIRISKGELNPFSEMRRILEKDRKEGMIPVLVFDELQKLKEIYLNSPNNQRPLINELFNFFVRLTKVLHLSHVIVMTSDTFFIERVYSDSTLESTSRFYLVDFFDDKTTLKILLEEGLPEKDAEYVIEMAGGVPWILEEVLEGNPREVIEELYELTLSRIYESTRKRRDLKEILKRAVKGENLYYEEEKLDLVKELVEKEVLFYDPIGRAVRFQNRLYEHAAREILKGKN